MIGAISGSDPVRSPARIAPSRDASAPADPDPRPARRDRVEISPEALALLAKEQAGTGACGG